MHFAGFEALPRRAASVKAFCCAGLASQAGAKQTTVNWDIPSPPNRGYAPATAAVGDSVVFSWSGEHNVVVLPGRALHTFLGFADCVFYGPCVLCLPLRFMHGLGCGSICLSMPGCQYRHGTHKWLYGCSLEECLVRRDTATDPGGLQELH